MIKIGDKVHILRESYNDVSSPRNASYSILLPDVDSRILKGNEGIAVTEVGETDGVSIAVKLENGHFCLVDEDFTFENGEVTGTGTYHLEWSDCPAVMWASWNAIAMPQPVRKAERGRMKWTIPGIGKVFMFYNEKKEDMYYESDYVSFDDKIAFTEKFGGYPLILEKLDFEPLTLNNFLTRNRLYSFGGRTSEFVKVILGDFSKLNQDQMIARWNKPVEIEKIINNLHLLAQHIQMPVRIVMKNAEGKYEWHGPIQPRS